MIGLTGAGTVTTAGPHTVSVQLSGGSDVLDEFFADALVTATYCPFGATGTDVLGGPTLSEAALSSKARNLGPRKRS